MKNLVSQKLTKMSGAGNTFLFVDASTKSNWSVIEKRIGKARPELVKIFCDKVFGLATDGVVFIEDGSADFDFHWDFYNSDGSRAEMCGNAARCAARFCSEELTAGKKKTFTFKTGAGSVSAEVLSENKFKVVMPEALWVQKDIVLKIDGSNQKFDLVNTGVPHLVQNLSSLREVEKYKEMARGARHHSDLKPQGANVTFYSLSSEGKIHAVTFERGVEDYTLACGTGAVAAAMVYAATSGEKKVTVTMPGGPIEVDFTQDPKHPHMTGGADLIGDFYYNLEVFK